MAGSTTYGTTGLRSKSSTDVDLAEIRSQLNAQGQDLAKIAGKFEKMTDAVTTMTVQMSHLVTKESCAEGRAALSDDLKKRMDSEREITGVGLPVKDLVKHFVSSKSGKSTPTPIPYKSHTEIRHTDGVQEKNKDRGPVFWIGLVSGIIAIMAAVYSSSVFIDRTIQRQEQTDRILLQIQQTLAENSKTPSRRSSNSTD